MPDALEVYLGTKEFRAFQRALHERPPKSVRMRVDRSSESLPFEHEPVPWYPLGFKLIDPKVRAGATLEYAVADFYIQDSASMLPLALLDIQPDDRVCDLCAAPGGKASAIAELLGTNGVLVANEVIAGRIDVLRYSLARTGRANYLVTNLDPDQLAQEFPANFDKVLVDVPCSGQSLLGRDRQSESAFAENHVLHCAARARRILQSAVQLLRPGGTLVLSTCTFSPEENEDQVTWLHSEYPGLFRAIEKSRLAPWKSNLGEGCYRLWPHRDSCAGGFAAALQLDESSPSLARLSQDESSRFTKKSKTTHNRSETNRFRKPKNEKNRRDDCSRGNTRSRTDRSGGNLSPKLDLVGKLSIPFFQSESYWYGFESGVQSWIEECELHLEHRIRTAIPRIATSKDQSIEPYHSLAMLAPDLFIAANTIQLNDAQAWRYLEGLTLERDGLATTTPWSIATWNSKPLGWLKAAPNRWNNYLPAWARFSGAANGSSPDGTIQAPES